MSLPTHAGQISFPGGKIDPQDATPLAAALREAHEEIALASEKVEILGELSDYDTSTGFLYLSDNANKPPKPPKPPSTSGLFVRFTAGLIRSIKALPVSILTPASW